MEVILKEDISKLGSRGDVEQMLMIEAGGCARPSMAAIRLRPRIDAGIGAPLRSSAR